MNGWNPRVNLFGDVASGSGELYVNGNHQGPGWHPHWQPGRSTIVYKSGIDQPNELNIHSGVSKKLSEERFTTIAAGGGVWHGVRFPFTDVTVSREGRVAYVEETGGNADRRLVALGGVVIAEHQPISRCRWEGDTILWSRNAGPRGWEVWGRQGDGPNQLVQLSTGMELMGVPIPTPQGMVALTQTQTELRLAKWGTTLGTIIALGNDQNLNPDAAWVEDTQTIHVVWNTSTGVLQRMEIPLSALITELLPPVVVEPPPVVGDRSMRVKAFPRKVYVFPYFSHHFRYGDTPIPDHVGNGIWVGGEGNDPAIIHSELTRIANYGMPMCVSTASAPPDPKFTDLTLTYYQGAGHINDFDTAIPRIVDTYPDKPIICYLDGLGWPSSKPSWMTNDRFWPSFPAYRNPGEPIPNFRLRCEAQFDILESYGNYFVLTPAFFTRNGQASVEEMVECMPIFDEWMQQYHICVLMPFSDRRPSGMVTHPIFREWGRAFLDANPQRPNRYDYWTPKGGSTESLNNKLRQDVDILVLTESERATLLNALNQTDPEPGPEPPSNDIQASEEFGMVQLVKAQHPLVNTCDDVSLDDGRALLTDWVAQRLNKRDRTTAWGRKSRGEPNNGVADRPNTDGLTYMRTDGRFEIIDIWIGAEPCDGTWHNHGPFSQGENGWWAPPQLPKETCHSF